MKIRTGLNDLATLRPDIASEWDYEKNNPLMPDEVFAGTDRKVWWTCKRGHEWNASISSRVSGAGCPICSGKAIVPGVNDLKSQYPAIAAEWNYEKNQGLRPEDFFACTKKKVWWICDKGHEYFSSISSRTAKLSGCPYCADRLVLKGFNDVGTYNSTLSAEWHPEKNRKSIGEYLPGSKNKVWWICPSGHEYEASVYSRAILGSGCPFCANKRIIPDENSLRATFPAVAAEWHPTKNGKLTPGDVSSGSNKKAWWICSKGHEWQAVIAGRTARQTSCPYCLNKKVLVGFNDLATLYPEIAAEWHPSLNGKKTPEMFTYGSSYKAWWICREGHEWAAPIARRAGVPKAGCPFCSGRFSYSKK